MTSSMTIEGSSPRLAHTLFFMFQSGGATFFRSTQLYQEILVDEMKNKLLSGYHGIQHAVSHYTPNAAPGTATPESIDLESQPDNQRLVTNIGREPEVALVHPLCNNPFTTQADDSGLEGIKPAARGENDSRKDPLIRPKRSRIWMVALIVGVLSLIVVPGLVIGVMTRQMSWGVELSGAIAPIVSLLAGLYYHHNK